ncbi:hypothetical protein COCNU_02G018510 [Cocos nucifera]|uniref:Uncharacterized protein n=1 Tax=Cocos nucifera TaxID=13894 RepID=A0A8K0I0W6_COCNU|nr:hypothetical protein COCNU_02G018510 [Cocos nucifera]
MEGGARGLVIGPEMRTEELEMLCRVMQKKRKASATTEESSKHPRTKSSMALVVPSPARALSQRILLPTLDSSFYQTNTYDSLIQLAYHLEHFLNAIKVVRSKMAEVQEKANVEEERALMMERTTKKVQVIRTLGLTLIFLKLTQMTK